MPKVDPLTMAEVVAKFGGSRKRVRLLMSRGVLTPVQKLPGKTGAYLFDRDAVETLATKRAAS
ncbi:hypothetical protein [Cellulomonas sp. 73-145]|uniref:hypothetical protein n=1 Tax=Cellulomonas sp. 73-145 TaxID=1895739 RepID=UPI001AC86F8D|nr:hypothetical protein [Cellulomonas sp. 73-145]MBN9326556.1 hypothetical protein [Cellulomonas sp.]